MVRKDRPLVQVSVAFEANRFGPRHLVEIYARLVPTVRRSRVPANRPGPSCPTPQDLKTQGGGHES